MYGYYGYPVPLTVSFADAGLTTVGYTIYQWNGSAWVVYLARQTNAHESPVGSGIYAVMLPANEFSGPFYGKVVWDNGNPNPALLEYAPEEIVLVEATATLAQVGEVLGLAGRNAGLRDPIYTEGNIAGFMLFHYDSPANAAVNDGVTGVVRSYQGTNDYDPSGNLLASALQRVT